MRGKAPLGGCGGFVTRITPACAGKSGVFDNEALANRDHPRVCGEKLVKEYVQFGFTGSPPRVRGKALHLVHIAHHVGITPACAGKSLFSMPTIGHARDHPRVCGEKYTDGLGECQRVGSPPRVRGKGIFLIIFVPAIRITPACAGKRTHLTDP